MTTYYTVNYGDIAGIPMTECGHQHESLAEAKTCEDSFVGLRGEQPHNLCIVKHENDTEKVVSFRWETDNERYMTKEMEGVPAVWTAYCMSGKKPHDIPCRPDIVYRDDWKGWDDFLGTAGWDDWLKERLLEMATRGCPKPEPGTFWGDALIRFTDTGS